MKKSDNASRKNFFIRDDQIRKDGMGKAKAAADDAADPDRMIDGTSGNEID